MCSHTQLFLRVLGIRTQVLMLTQQRILPTEPLSVLAFETESLTAPGSWLVSTKYLPVSASLWLRLQGHATALGLWGLNPGLHTCATNTLSIELYAGVEYMHIHAHIYLYDIDVSICVHVYIYKQCVCVHTYHVYNVYNFIL